MSRTQLTPIELLRLNKIEIQRKCRLKEKALTEDFDFVQDNALTLITCGVSYILFPKKNKNEQAPKTDKPARTSSLDLAYYISLAKSVMPLAWDIVKPVITMWSIKKIQTLLLRIFMGKK